MAYEQRLSRLQADRIIHAIVTSLPGFGQAWQYYVDAELDRLYRTLDLAYSCDQDGNGWIVLSRLDSIFWSPVPSQQPRAGAWNVLSPIFNDRKSIVAKLDAIREMLESIQELTYEEGYARLDRWQHTQPLNLLDGPLPGSTLVHFASSTYRRNYSRLAAHRATIVAVALSAYRAEHDAYPATLSALVSEYLREVPVDPFDGAPIRYLPKPGEDDFLLYSVGPGLTDNGGRTATKPAGGRPQSDIDNSDMLFDHTRRVRLYSEISLEDNNP